MNIAVFSVTSYLMAFLAGVNCAVIGLHIISVCASSILDCGCADRERS